MKKSLQLITLIIGIVALSLFFTDVRTVLAQGNSPDNGSNKGKLQIDSDDIGGRVHVQGGHKGIEAGLWVIAETGDGHAHGHGGDGELGTTHRVIVVTNEQGKFVLPDLPHATYNVWVRGYGVADSSPVQAQPGDKVQLFTEHVHGQEAAEVYPANSWLALLDLPENDELALSSFSGNKTDWLSRVKLGCELCHQMGNEHTRHHETPLEWNGLLNLSGTMNFTAIGMDRDLVIEKFSDWATRIGDGEIPPTPAKPEGKERNFVIRQWEWGDGFTYAHDEVATDKRTPWLYANEKVWGVDLGLDRILAVDPVANEAFQWNVPTMNGFDTPWCDQTFVSIFDPGATPSFNGFCSWNVYDNPANPHNPMLDDEGNLWITSQIRREWHEDYPDFCLDDPAITGTAASPRRHHRQLAIFDTESEEFTLVDTCYGTHHLQFDFEDNLWLSGDVWVLGMFDPSEFDPSDPTTLEDAQDWWEHNVDSDGDGVPDTLVPGFNYGVIPNPVDGTIWTAVPGSPGHLKRFDPENPDQGFEMYEPPAPGHGPRGVDADTEGNIWTCLGGSSHVAKFDRDECSQTWGLGDQCPEGWTLWEIPGPDFTTETEEGTRRTDFHYYAWVDQYNTSGLGENTVFCTGTGSDSLIAFDPDTEEFTRIRIPYPLTAYMRGLDGRIDDPDAGWKGRGLWADYGNDPIKHAETEQGQIYQVQFRPDPLAH